MNTTVARKFYFGGHFALILIELILHNFDRTAQDTQFWRHFSDFWLENGQK